MRLRMIFSRILPKTGRKLMGLYKEEFYGGLPGLSTMTMTDNFQVGRFLTTLLQIRSWLWNLLLTSFFITPTISVGQVDFLGRAIGKGDWRDSMTVYICSAGVFIIINKKKL